MSKADGKYIGVLFAEEITSSFGAISSYDFEPNSGVTVTVSGGGTAIANMANGNYSDYGYVTNTAGRWIQLQLPSAKAAKGFRWYVNSANYAFTAFTVSGSNDGTTFTDIASLTGTATVGWHEFSFTNSTAYIYYRFTCTSYTGSYFFCNEIELKTLGIETLATAFTISGFEYNFVPNGSLQATEYTVKSVAAHPTIAKAILLELKDNDRFESAIGQITVSYDKSKGTLAGYGGPVDSFSISFTPSDLVWKGDQNDQEHISISSISGVGTFIQVYYTNLKAEEHVAISSISAVGVLTNVNDL